MSIEVLQAWLRRVNATPLWSQGIFGFKHKTVTAYSVNGRPVLCVNDREDGWELYVQSTDKNSVEASLDGAAVALGVDGCAGLLDKKGGA